MRILSAMLSAVAVMFALYPSANAAGPPFLPLQGVLTDKEGTPLEAEVTARFSIYTGETGGTAIWSETQSVLVENGLFTVYLGQVEALDLALFRDHSELWLGVQVEPDPEMGRVYMGSTPFSGYAEFCGSVPDHTHGFSQITGTLPESSLPDGVVVGSQSCPGTDKVSGVDSNGGLVCAADLGGSLGDLGCTSNQVIKWNGSSWKCAADLDSDTQLSEAQVDRYVSDNGYATGGSVVTRTTNITCYSDGADYSGTVSCPSGSILLDCGIETTGDESWTHVDAAFYAAFAGKYTHYWVSRASDGGNLCHFRIQSNNDVHCDASGSNWTLRAFCLMLNVN